jgi:hypothetical protein
MGSRPEIGEESVGAGQSLYWFMKATNKSLTRKIELTHVWFAGAKDDELLTWSEPLPARLKHDQTWEGWLNAARLAHASNVEQSGRALISGKARPIRSRKNKHVHQSGQVARR